MTDVRIVFTNVHIGIATLLFLSTVICIHKLYFIRYFQDFAISGKIPENK